VHIISSLKELVAPLTESEFLTLLRQRKLTLLRGTNADRYSKLLSWEALKRIIEGGEYWLEDVRVTKEKVIIPPLFYLTDGKLDAAKLEVLLAHGASIIMTHLQRKVPSIASLCDNIKLRLPERIIAGMILTTGAGGALDLHYDSDDLIILQVEGTKRWQIYGPTVAYPVKELPKELPSKSVPIFDEFLLPGDFLFVPSGNWHQCENGPGRSLHLGIGFVPPNVYYAMKAITSKLLYEEMFRVPLTRIESSSERAKVEANLIDRLKEKINQQNLSKFLAEWAKQT
jgi:ribosomal protein L16 Arg81 hydroxylase